MNTFCYRDRIRWCSFEKLLTLLSITHSNFFSNFFGFTRVPHELKHDHHFNKHQKECADDELHWLLAQDQKQQFDDVPKNPKEDHAETNERTWVLWLIWVPSCWTTEEAEETTRWFRKMNQSILSKVDLGRPKRQLAKYRKSRRIWAATAPTCLIWLCLKSTAVRMFYWLCLSVSFFHGRWSRAKTEAAAWRWPSVTATAGRFQSPCRTWWVYQKTIRLMLDTINR